MDDLEKVSPPKIGGTLPHDEYIRVLYSIAKSLKRIACAMEAPAAPTVLTVANPASASGARAGATGGE